MLGQAQNVEVYCEVRSTLGEGPLWRHGEQTLYWIDIAQKRLHSCATTDRKQRSWTLPDYPGCLAELASGAIGIAMGPGLQRLDLSSGGIDLLKAAPPGRARTRFNDGKVDPCGRLWAGTMQNNFGPHGELIAIDRAEGSLYRFDLEGDVHTIEESIGVANTLAWSPDSERFYFADSLLGQIYVYDYDAASGDVRNKRLFFEGQKTGVPDGSAIDIDGCLWNARWDGAVILRITPRGNIDRIVELPVPRPTSCAFGGSRLETLYVTSASLGLSVQQLHDAPLSGAVFAIQAVTQGLPVPAMNLPSR